MRKYILPLLGLLLFCAIPASATITLDQHFQQNLPSSGGVVTWGTWTGTAGNTICISISYSVPSGPAVTVIGVTNGSDVFVEAPNLPAVNTNFGTNTASVDGWCTASTFGGSHTLTIQLSGNPTGPSVQIYEFHSSLGTMIADGGQKASNIAAGSTPVGASLTTTGNDMIIASIKNLENSTTGFLANGGVTFTAADVTTDGYLLNQTSGTYQPKWQLGGSVSSAAAITYAFKEPAGASGGGGIGGKAGIGGKVGFSD